MRKRSIDGRVGISPLSPLRLSFKTSGDSNSKMKNCTRIDVHYIMQVVRRRVRHFFVWKGNILGGRRPSGRTNRTCRASKDEHVVLFSFRYYVLFGCNKRSCDEKCLCLPSKVWEWKREPENVIAAPLRRFFSHEETTRYLWVQVR